MSDPSFIRRMDGKSDTSRGISGMNMMTPPHINEEGDPITVCCIGTTGSGKSTIMNAIFHGANFENGPFKHDFRGQACTNQTSFHE